MSDFKALVHQIQFRLELCPRPCWGSFPDSVAGFKGPTVTITGLQDNPCIFLAYKSEQFPTVQRFYFVIIECFKART